MDPQNTLSRRHWKMLVASLLTVGVTGSAWAGEGEGERIRIEKVVTHPCATVTDGEVLPGMTVRSRGFLGVELTSLTPDLRRHFGVPGDLGVMVGKVVEDSAAFRAGLAVGDILTRVDGKDVDGPWELTSAIRSKSGGEVVDLEYWRDGKVDQLSVTLDEKEGCVVDLGSTVHRIEELGERLPEVLIHAMQIREEAMSEAMEALGNIDWEEHLKGLQDVEIDLQLEEKMELLQEEMRSLEERLAAEDVRIEIIKEREKELKEQHKERLKMEKEVRKEMIRAQEEARRAREEAHREQMEAQREIEREAAEAAREAEQEARRLTEEAEREARRQAEEAERRAAEEGGGKIVV